MPGLLQTAAYYEALQHAADPDGELAAQQQNLRRERQALLDRTDKPLQYQAVVHESAFQIPVGGTTVMAEQLDYLIERGRLPNVELQVLPISAGAYPMMGTAFHLVTFGPDHAEGVYLENLHHRLYVEEDPEIEPYTLNFERLKDLVLDPEASARRLVKIRDGWASDKE